MGSFGAEVVGVVDQLLQVELDWHFDLGEDLLGVLFIGESLQVDH